MQPTTKLVLIKIIHTLIWICFNIVIFTMLYLVMVNKMGPVLWIGYGLVFTEGLVLLAFNGVCPLTIVANKFSDASRSNFDIYLPNWLARYNKKIYTTIVIVIAVLTVYRLLTNHTTIMAGAGD